jgi:thiosulfate dehydrogenase (quinone) large subunit
MNDSTEKPNDACASKCCNCDYTLAFLVLRGWLGLRALLAGVEKYGAYKSVQVPVLDEHGQPDPGGAVLDMKVKFYSLANYTGVPTGLKTKFANEALLPGFALNIFDKCLGPALIAAGVMLLIGLGTRVSLMLQGLIYISLSVGLILINQPDGISFLGTHIALVAGALVLAKHNKFTLCKKC